jgi:hypothetical protein
MRAIIISVTALLLMFVGIRIHSSYEKNRAASFLGHVSSLSLGSANIAQVRQLIHDYGGEAGQRGCTPESCVYFFSFDNDWFYRLRLAPHTRLTCALGVEGGVLKYRHVFFTSGNTSAAFGAFTEERLSPQPGVPAPFYVSRQWDASGAYWRVHIEMTPAASPEQRRMGYGFNLNCLNKLGGCSNVEQLLPTIIWEGNS